MSTIESSSKGKSMPDMNAIAQSIKTLHRSVPAIEDSQYSYFSDNMKMGSTLAENIDREITNALTTLPTSLQELKSVEAFASNISKINAAEKAGKMDEATANKGRKQLETRINEAASSVITSFQNSSNNLSDPAERLAKNSNKISVRLKDAEATETASHDRLKSDADRENARLNTLHTRYQKLEEAVDEKRGGPVDELLAIIPDEKELSSLLDVGAEDAAAPEVAAAKKAIELAVAQLKKALDAIGKVIEFEQLADMRDEVFKALQAQRKVVNSVEEQLEQVNRTLGQLKDVKSAGNAMGVLSKEVNKIAITFSRFVNSLKNLDGKEITDTTINDLYHPMSIYLDEVRTAKNQVILG